MIDSHELEHEILGLDKRIKRLVIENAPVGGGGGGGVGVETDPVFAAWLLATPPLYPGGWYDAVQNTIGLSGFDNDSGFITSFDDEKVKYDAGDPTAGYVADKIIAGTGISVAEGIGANENKLVVTSDITQYTDSDAIAAIQGDASWNASDWDTAYGWGNHASAGYVTGTPWTAEGYLTSISGESIGSLSDVVDTGKDTGKVLKYNAVSGDWEVGDDNDTTYASGDFDHNALVNTHNLTTDIDHDALTNFVANEHIDWTNTSEDFSTTGNVECDGITATGNGSFQTINANLIGFLDYTMFDNFNKNELHNAYYRGTVTYTLTGAGIVPSESNAMFDGVEGNRLIISGAADNTTELTVDIELDEALDTYSSAIWQPFVKFRSFTSYSYFRGIEVFVSADGISYVNPSGDAWKTTDSSVDSVYSGLWFGSDGIPTGGYPIKYIRFVFTDHYNTYSGSNPQCVYISEIGLRHKSAPFSRDFVQAVNGKHWGEHNFYPAGSTTSPNISLDSETGDITAGDIRASNVDSVTGYKNNGTAGIDTTFLDANGNTFTVSGGIITAKKAP